MTSRQHIILARSRSRFRDRQSLLRAERDLDRVGQLIDATQDGLP